MTTREEALAFILQHERSAMRDFEKFVHDKIRSNHFILPPEIRSKFLLAGGSYGEFKLNHDWMQEAESEVWDGVMYMGLARMKREMFDPAVHKAATLRSYFQ